MCGGGEVKYHINIIIIITITNIIANIAKMNIIMITIIFMDTIILTVIWNTVSIYIILILS